MSFPTPLLATPRDIHARVPLPVAIPLAALAGWVMDMGFPDRDWWPLALLGAGLMILSVRGISFPKAVLVGVIGALSFYGIHIWWLTVYLGLIPWIALVLSQVFFFSLGLGLISLVWRYGSAQWTSLPARLLGVPALVGAAWMTREALSSVFPWGGFAWARFLKASPRAP